MNPAHETLDALARTLPNAFVKSYEKAQGEVRNFKSAIQIPRSENRHLISRSMDRIIYGQSFEEATFGLTHSEKTLVRDLVAEFTAWASLDEKPSSEQSPVSVEPVLIGSKEE